MMRSLKSWIVLLLTLLVGMALGQDQTVRWSAQVVGGDPAAGGKLTIELKAEIEPGWKLYALPPTQADNTPTTIDAVAPAKLSGTPSQPKPQRKFDPNFEKEVDFFEGSAVFTVPLEVPAGSDAPKLKVRFQTCNENLCLPPTEVEVTVGEEAAVEDPVRWSASVNGDVVELRATIAKGWKLYAMGRTDAGNVPTTIGAMPPLELNGEVTQPKPTRAFDPNFDADVDFFKDSVTFTVPIKRAVPGGKLLVNYQSCNEELCLPPTQLEVPIDGSSVVPSAGTAGPGSEQDQVEEAKSQGLLSFMLFAFGAGLLALLTPCVFPMVPITVSFFAKRRETLGSKSGLGQAAAYCGGIIGAFTVFGLLVTVLFGASGIQQFATNPWVNIAIGILFVVLALNLFGFYQINVPSGIANRFSPQGKAGWLAPVLMGLTFTITSFTCTVPFVGTILVSAASGGDWVYPFFGMLAFGTAFSLPFFFLALFPQFLATLPKSGAWLEAVKGYMGFLELAAAVKFFSNADLVWNTGILTKDRFLWSWILIGLATLAFLIGWIKLPHVQMPKRIGRGRGVVLALTSLTVVYLALGLRGNSLGELEAFLPPSAPPKGWYYTYEEAQRVSKQTGRPMFVNFTGVTCTNCRWMEKNMFPRQDVSKELEKYVKAELFTDRQTEADRKNQELQRKLTGSVTLPIYLILTPEGKVIRKFGGSTRDAEEFVTFLSGASDKVAKR